MRKIIDNEHERVGLWIQNHGGGFYRDGTKCIGLEKDGQLIAGTMYDWFNGASIYMHVASDGKGWLDREFLWYVFAYPFNQLGAKVVLGLVSEDNIKAQVFDEHLGFKLISVIPDGDPSGSLLIYAMYKDECKWLTLRKNHVKTVSACAA